MELWFFADTPFGFRLLLVPQNRGQRARLAPSDAAPVEGRSRDWERGVALTLSSLPWTFVLARPVDSITSSAATWTNSMGDNLYVRIEFCTDTADCVPLAPQEDGIGLMSLFAEYVQVLTEVFDSLEIFVRSLAPTKSGICMEIPFVGDAAPGVANERVERLLLATATADWLARGRGFRLREVHCASHQGDWRALDGSWLAVDDGGFPAPAMGVGEGAWGTNGARGHRMKEP